MGREHKQDTFRPSSEELGFERPVNPIHDVGPTVPGGLSREDLKGEPGTVDTAAHDGVVHLTEAEADEQDTQKRLEAVRRVINQ